MQAALGPLTVRAARHPSTPGTEAGVLTNIVVALAIFIFAGSLCYKRPGVMTIALSAVPFNGFQYLIFDELLSAVAGSGGTTDRRLHKRVLRRVGLLPAEFGLRCVFPTIAFGRRPCASPITRGPRLR